MRTYPLVIADDYPFLARNIRSGLDGETLESATGEFVLLDEDGDTVVSGNMTEYDDPLYPDGLSLQANIAAVDTEDLSPKREYRLRTSITANTRRTSRTIKLIAVEDEYEE